MNELLNELLSHILVEAGAPPKPTKDDPRGIPNGYFHRGRGMYYNRATGGSYMGKVVDDKWYAAGKEPKTTKTKAQRDASKPIVKVDKPNRYMGKTPAKSDTSALTGELETKAGLTKDPVKKQILLDLTTALKSGNRQKIQAVVDKYGILMGSSKRLKAAKTKLAKGEFLGKDMALSDKIHAALQQSGVDVQSRGKDTGESKANVEEFKPQSLFADQPLGVLDVEKITGGINVEGIEVKEITPDQAKRIEDILIKKAKKQIETQGGTFDEGFESRVRFYIQRRIESTNNNIKYLLAAAEAGGDAYQFEGEEGVSDIKSGVSKLITKYVPSDKQAVANTALDAMGSAKTPREFNDAWVNFDKAVKGTPLAKNAKYVVETLTALRVVAFGGVALIPTKDTYELADVISLSRSPITGTMDIKLFLTDVDEETEITAAGSVKLKRGAASVNRGKVKNSRFVDGEQDGIDCSAPRKSLLPSRKGMTVKGVQGDLADLSTTELKNHVFSGEGEDVSDEVQNMAMDYVERYGPMLRAYYGIPEDVSDEEMYEMLSYGKKLECVDGSPQAPSEPFKEGQPGHPHSGAWRVWSVLGSVAEAVHNRTVEQQYYHTVKYNPDGVVIADGIRTLSKMEFQHMKNKTPKGKPDSSMPAFTVPAKMDEVRNGNPCR